MRLPESTGQGHPPNQDHVALKNNVCVTCAALCPPPLSAPSQVVRQGEGVRGLRSRSALLVQHHPGPAPLHALRDLGGGVQPAGTLLLWCHHARHPGRGWVPGGGELWPASWQSRGSPPLSFLFKAEVPPVSQWALRLCLPENQRHRLHND